MARRGSLALSDALDEEIRETLSDSPTVQKAQLAQPTSPQSSYARATLGVDSRTPRHGSIAGIGVGVTSPNQPKKKRLDPSDPSTWTSSVTASSVETRPRASSESYGGSVPTFQFDGPSEVRKETVENTVLNTVQTTAPERRSSGTMAAALSGDLNKLNIGPEDTTQAIQEIPRTPDESSSMTPPSGMRKHLQPSPAGLSAEPDAGKDRRFSTQSASFSTVTDDSDRIGSISIDDSKDVEDALQESSDEEHSSSEPDEASPVAERGRRRKTHHEKSPSPEKTRYEVGHEPEALAPVSPRIKVDEADSTSKTPDHHSGALSETKGSSISPRSNYDIKRAASPAAISLLGDDDAELKRAKALELRVSPVDEMIKDRTVQLLLRGSWEAFQDADGEEQTGGFRHEPRLYLVCSDLSNEATYALEWTVGTLLKDGDTLLIMSANEDEHATKHKETEEPSLEVRLESAKAAEEANSTMDTLTRQTTGSHMQPDPGPKSKLSVGVGAARSLSRTGRPRNGREDERLKAVEKLEADFLRYVRKTTLQVRCMIEVIHCRSPRHLILNAIDELEPTLVVVGTRGQSTVKGVVMGSFSNYLVTKSSVPVMVARKRLKKAHHAKVSSQQIRMTNNLTPLGIAGKRKSLQQARID